MCEVIDTFTRVEDKYELTDDQVKEIISKMKDHIVPDIYYQYTVHSIYYDTDHSQFIINSLQKQKYKMKLRLRGYGQPDGKSPVFLETKKKYGNIVYKKGIQLEEQEAYDYLDYGFPHHVHNNTAEEIEYLRNTYHLSPKVLILYDRTCFASTTEADVRVTFDRNIRYRIDDVNLKERGDEKPLNPGKTIMEIKAMDRYPLWLTKILSEMKLYKDSFSKYGTIYKDNAQMMYPQTSAASVYETSNTNQEVNTCSVQY